MSKEPELKARDKVVVRMTRVHSGVDFLPFSLL